VVARAAAVSAIVLGTACHQVTEYGSVDNSGLIVLEIADMEPVAEIEGFEGGRSLCSLGLGQPGFMIACNTGRIFVLDTEGFAIDFSRVVGSPFSQGYDDMTVTPTGEIYLIGAFGQLLRLSSQGIVTAQFPVGPSPGSLSPSLTGAARLYVCDDQDLVLREVSTATHEIVRELQLPAPVAAIYPVRNDSTAWQVAVSAIDGRIFMVDAGGYLAYRELSTSFGVCTDAAAMQDTAVCCIASPGYGTGQGGVTIIRGLRPMETTLTEIPLEGRPSCVAASPQNHLFYVASVTEAGYTAIHSVDALTGQVSFIAEIQARARNLLLVDNEQYLAVLTAL
jgi:hypothetical protein